MKKPKLKNIYLAVGFVITSIIAYKVSISKTFDLKNEYNLFLKEANFFKDMPTQLAVFKKKEKYYDTLLTEYQIGKGSIQYNLLKTLNLLSEEKKIKLTSFVEPHVIKQNDLTEKIYEFSLEGNYNSILETIYYIEQNTKFGEVINVHFKLKKQNKTKQKYLQARVLLKSFG